MKNFSKKGLFELLLICIIGLIPIFWFQGREVILGHDAGLTINAVPHFFDRLFLWTERYGYGHDQTYALAGFFIHGLETLVALLGFDLQTQQKIVFIFWFVLPGLTMYYFASKLSKQLRINYFALPVSIFYMANHFLLQGWLIAERTKFSLYAALPLVMAFLFDWEDKKRSTLKTAIFISLTLFLLNGEGSLPLFGGLLVALVVFIIFYFLKRFSFSRLGVLIKLFCLTGIFYALLNSYWLIPYGNYVLKSYASEVVQAGGEGGVLGWLGYISKNSSLINLLRLQGIPEWYDNPYHPYANNFLHNPLLIFIGFMLPVLAFASLFLYRKEIKTRKYILFFAFLALFSMVFVAGSHPPFGPLYILFFKFIPGFIAFRTPFYKFSPALWFAYSLLIGFTISHLFQKLKVSNKIRWEIYLACCIGIIFYSYPFLNGSFFNYQGNERSMKVHLPSYVYNFGEFSKSSERRNIKTLLLPPQSNNFRADIYTWGYWSLTPLTSLLTNSSFISNNGTTPPSQAVILDSLYQDMKQKNSNWVHLAKLMGVKSFLLRKDFVWKSKETPTDNPLVYEDILNRSDIKLVKKFGEWEVYDFVDNDTNDGQVMVVRSLSYLIGTEKDLGVIASLSTFTPGQIFFIADKTKENMVNLANKIYVKPECINCPQQPQYINTSVYMPLLVRGSIFYPFVKIENNLLKQKIEKKPIKEKLKFYLEDSLRNVLAFQKAIDQKVERENVLLIAQDYQQSLEELNIVLQNYLLSDSTEKNGELINAKDIIRTEETIFVDKAINTIDSENTKVLNRNYELLQKIKNTIGQNIWQTSDVKKRFLVIAPKSENYQMLYRYNDEMLSESENVTFFVDDKEFSVKPTATESGWMGLGSIPLSKGSHKLEIVQGSPNLYVGNSSNRVTASSQGSCFFTNPIKGKKGDLYKMSFKHERISGSKNFYVKIKNSRSNKPVLDIGGDVLRGNFYKDNYQSYYSIGDDEETFYLALCNNPTTDNVSAPSIIELSGIVIEKISTPDVMFYATTRENDQIAKINVDKKSQTEYSIHVDSNDQDYLLMLNQTYNSNWKIDNIKNTKFTVNGYANGWIVDGKHKDIVIKYESQDLVKIGFIVTGLTISLLIFIQLFLFAKKHA